MHLPGGFSASQVMQMPVASINLNPLLPILDFEDVLAMLARIGTADSWAAKLGSSDSLRRREPCSHRFREVALRHEDEELRKVGAGSITIYMVDFLSVRIQVQSYSGTKHTSP